MKEDLFVVDDDGTPKAEYVDCFRIGHSAYKFFLDFGQFTSESGEKVFHTRVVTGPDIAKALATSFGQSIWEYEEQFGRIVNDL